jgi:hypothetical protein
MGPACPELLALLAQVRRAAQLATARFAAVGRQFRR